MSEEELGLAIFSQLAEVAMKYWSEDSKNPVVVNKILDGLKIRYQQIKQKSAECKECLYPVLNQIIVGQGIIIRFKISFWRESAGKYEES